MNRQISENASGLRAHVFDDKHMASSAVHGAGDVSSAVLDSDPPAGSLDDILATTERRQILNALERAGGQRASAARLLRISRSRLYRRMGALGIEPHSNGDHKPV